MTSGRRGVGDGCSPMDVVGRVEWLGGAEVPLFNILVHLLAEGHGTAFWADRRARIEAAARAAGD